MKEPVGGLTTQKREAEERRKKQNTFYNLVTQPLTENVEVLHNPQGLVVNTVALRSAG